MVFMGAMMLIVLPLFLVVSARMTAASDFGKSAAGKFVELIFYSFAAFCVFGLGLLIFEIVTSQPSSYGIISVSTRGT